MNQRHDEANPSQKPPLAPSIVEHNLVVVKVCDTISVSMPVGVKQSLIVQLGERGFISILGQLTMKWLIMKETLSWA
jgi:hypothetical protein